MKGLDGVVEDAEKARHRIARLYALEELSSEELQYILNPCLELLSRSTELRDRHDEQESELA